ncbi:hypothetical protein [Mycobacterium sp. ENV421]|uniref:hypothetical protein n=1 Tax=Mycobacterium sp. ENV421 TaxID=1213407 RepID=UPI001157D6CC|nr:hypothetical protein [Mycobacterium sp. ENV421]
MASPCRCPSSICRSAAEWGDLRRTDEAASPTASAADGCGIGYHLDGPNCVLNVPGPNAHFISPNCWINVNNDERCYAP